MTSLKWDNPGFFGTGYIVVERFGSLVYASKKLSDVLTFLATHRKDNPSNAEHSEYAVYAYRDGVHTATKHIVGATKLPVPDSADAYDAMGWENAPVPSEW